MLDDKGRSLKHITILGGTGTLGQAIIKHLVKNSRGLQKITVASRSEHKHAEMRKRWPEIKYVLCDIRDYESILRVTKKQDVVFHVAALKHVDILEDNPLESIKTNVLGTENVARACIENGIKYCLFSSTDKAVDPINTYGYSKAISEKLLLHYNDTQLETKFQVFRWGNVLGSQGSVIPQFIESIKLGRDITVTDESMTRFWIRIEDAVSFMFDNLNNKSNSVLIHPDMRAASLMDVINAIAYCLDRKPVIKIIGLRKGEKLHEALSSQHSRFPSCSKTARQYKKDELIALLRPLCEAHG